MPRPSSSATTVGLAQWGPPPGHAEENLATAVDLVATLAGRGCDLVVLPELWPCGYDPATLAADVRATAEPLDGPRGQVLAATAREHAVWLFAGSVPELAGGLDGQVFNTAVVYAHDGSLRAAHRKVHLYAPLGEHLVFAAGTTPTVVEVDGLGPVGLSTCYDGDHPEYVRELRRLGARVVVSGSAYEVGAETWWDVLYPAHALLHGQWWLMTNQCGGEGPSALLGGSRVVAPDGRVVTEAVRHRPGQDGTDLLVVTLDLAGGIDRVDAHPTGFWDPPPVVGDLAAPSAR